MKKTKGSARNATRENNISKKLNLDNKFLSQYDNNWHSVTGGEKREKKKKPKMLISGKSVFQIKKIKDKKSN